MMIDEAKWTVVVAEDSLVFQKALTKAIGENERLECVATAADGRQAVQKVTELHPDILILDLEMPVMGGIETLKTLFEEGVSPKVVVVFSAHSVEGADLTLEALRHGATDFVTKPSAGSLTEGQRAIRNLLLPRVVSLAQQIVPKKKRANLASSPVAEPRREPPKAPPRSDFSVARGRKTAVGVAVSTGGPGALQAIVSELPESLAAPMFVVQHMPEMFTARLARRLDGLTAIHVLEAQDGQLVEPNHIYIAPGGRHMLVRATADNRPVIVLDDSPPVHSCRPSADLLFRSLAKVYGKDTLGVVLTGIGRDGTDGSYALRSQGAPVLAQDEATSVVYGMPKMVAEEGLATEIVPLDKMARRIAYHTGSLFKGGGN